MQEHPTFKGYFVTKDGRVFTTTRPGGLGGKCIRNTSPKELRQSSDKRGYRRVNIQVGLYNQKKFAVHRLVAETYLPNPHNLSDVHHKDNNPRNNNLDNLEWVSHKQNCELSRDNIGQNKAAEWKILHIETNKTFVIKNLAKWCEENNLNRSNLHKTLTKVNHHKGYKILEKINLV